MESTAPAHGEARWPMAAAVLAGLVLTMLRPAEVRVTPRPVLPAVEMVLLGVLIPVTRAGSTDGRPGCVGCPSPWSPCWRSTPWWRPSTWSPC